MMKIKKNILFLIGGAVALSSAHSFASDKNVYVQATNISGLSLVNGTNVSLLSGLVPQKVMLSSFINNFSLLLNGKPVTLSYNLYADPSDGIQSIQNGSAQSLPISDGNTASQSLGATRYTLAFNILSCNTSTNTCTVIVSTRVARTNMRNNINTITDAASLQAALINADNMLAIKMPFLDNSVTGAEGIAPFIRTLNAKLTNLGVTTPNCQKPTGVIQVDLTTGILLNKTCTQCNPGYMPSTYDQTTGSSCAQCAGNTYSSNGTSCIACASPSTVSSDHTTCNAPAAAAAKITATTSAPAVAAVKTTTAIASQKTAFTLAIEACQAGQANCLGACSTNHDLYQCLNDCGTAFNACMRKAATLQ